MCKGDAGTPIPSWFADFAIVFLQNGFEQASELGRKVKFRKVAYVRTKRTWLQMVL